MKGARGEGDHCVIITRKFPWPESYRGTLGNGISGEHKNNSLAHGSLLK